MARDPRYDILFEPVRIGPVTAKNRFYQVPHCNGMGFDWPHAHTRMRELKAAGGWAVVCAEETMIHPTADGAPWPQARLWDDGDARILALMVDAVHRHDALAGVELAHSGMAYSNLFTRLAPVGPSDLPVRKVDPVQARAMDKADIRELRHWHRQAALRARAVDADIVYVYAGHDLSVFLHFMSRRYNHRTDEYGGSLENRVRLLREVIEDTKAAVGDRCGVVVRLAVDELLGPDGLTTETEGRETIEMLAELPDMWDVNLSDFGNDAPTGRFVAEGHQEAYIAFVKRVTSKPVVGVGWFTSPDTMASQIRRGVLDMIGAARPFIADPFLPHKVEQGRIVEIRECIACNVCIAFNDMNVPMRCTQNPTAGEEWRRGWHPELIEPKGSDDSVLVVGAGPAGLEAAQALGQRGYEVILAEAGTELGGRVTQESGLPGLAAWARVRDWRLGRIQEMANVTIYRDSRLTAQDILEFGFARVFIATGARWRHDGVGRTNWSPVPGLESAVVLTLEDLCGGAAMPDPVVMFDDDSGYLGGVLAEKLATDGRCVTLVTPEPEVSPWTRHTLDQRRIQRRLLELDVRLALNRNLVGVTGQEAELACTFTGAPEVIPAAAIVLVTARLPNDEIYRALTAEPHRLDQAGIESVRHIGDCYAPGLIAAAIHDGHRAARELDGPSEGAVPFRRERIALEQAV